MFLPNFHEIEKKTKFQTPLNLKEKRYLLFLETFCTQKGNIIKTELHYEKPFSSMQLIIPRIGSYRSHHMET